MNDAILMDVAQKFDLNVYETKIWLTLLSKGTLTATEISEYSTVPRSRTYDVLEGLEKKGFVAIKPGRPLRYFAIPPKMVVERMKINVMNELREKLELMDSLKESEFLQQLTQLYETNQDIADIAKIGEHLNNFQVYDKIRELLKHANESIRIMATVNELYRLLDNTGGSLYTALKRGLLIRIIAIGKPDSTLEKFFGKENILYVDDLKMRMIIVDSNSAIFLVNEQASGLWTNSMFVGKEFAKWFDFVWEKEKAKELKVETKRN